MQVQQFVFRPFTLPDLAEAPPEEAPVVPEEPEAPAAPSFSEDELLAAQREAEAIGYAKGREAAQAEIDQITRERDAHVTSLLAQIQAGLEGLAAEANTAREAERQQMAAIVLAAASKMAGHALEAHPLAAIEAMLDECLLMLAGEPKLMVVVHPSLKAPLEERLGAISHGGQVVTVQENAALAKGDCRIEWPGGKARRDQQALWCEIEDVVNRALAPGDEDSMQQTDNQS